MNPLDIPEIRTEIFLNLNGGHLHRCRQVCKDWDKFIQEMWKIKPCQKRFEGVLSQNWRFPILNHEEQSMKYEFRSDLYNVPFQCCFIDATSSNKIVLRTWNNVPIEYSRVVVYSMEEALWWEIPGVNQGFAGRADGDDFRLIVTETLVAIRINLIGEMPRCRVRVWSLQTHQLIFDETFLNLQYMCSNDFESSNIMVFFSETPEAEIKILNCSDLTKVHTVSGKLFYG